MQTSRIKKAPITLRVSTVHEITAELTTSLIAFLPRPKLKQSVHIHFRENHSKVTACLQKDLAPLWSLELGKARFRRRSTDGPNLTNQLSTAKERRLNQFRTAVLVRCRKSSTVCRTFVELNLASTHGAPSEPGLT